MVLLIIGAGTCNMNKTVNVFQFLNRTNPPDIKAL